MADPHFLGPSAPKQSVVPASTEIFLSLAPQARMTGGGGASGRGGTFSEKVSSEAP